MNVIDLGTGAPVVVVPGVQGRWEWMKPGIDALAHRCRVITFSLCDEPRSGGRFDPSIGFGCYVEQIGEALDSAGIESAAICGVSYGGLIAAAFAARHPRRVQSLVLISALPPSWRPDARIRLYLRAPRLLAPLFWARAPLTMYPEIAAAIPDVWERSRTTAAHGWRVLTHPTAPLRMSRRVHLLADEDMTAEIGRITAPTLVMTGDPRLDRVVPARATLEYAQLIPHATAVRLERCGHIGFVTRPEALADVVAPFVERHDGGSDRARLTSVHGAAEERVLLDPPNHCAGLAG